jgi:hypothetical protein
MLSWRGQNNDSDGDRYYLAHATGFTATQLTTQDLYQNATAAANIGAGFVSVSASNNFSLRGQTRRNKTRMTTTRYSACRTPLMITKNSKKLRSSVIDIKMGLASA